MKIWKYEINRANPNESNEKPYQINTGFSANHYSERLIEQPYIFRYIRYSIPPASVLDIGCWESIISIQLAALGYDVTGIDIQDYGYQHPNFNFIHDDFNKHDFGNKKYDIIIDISAIEHFGLLAYTNTERDDDADKKAIEKVKHLLKPKGQFLFTAPFGVHGEVKNFERIYDLKDINSMFKGFSKIAMRTYAVINYKIVQEIPIKEAEKMNHDETNHTYAVICIDAEKT